MMSPISRCYCYCRVPPGLPHPGPAGARATTGREAVCGWHGQAQQVVDVVPEEEVHEPQLGHVEHARARTRACTRARSAYLVCPHSRTCIVAHTSTLGAASVSVHAGRRALGCGPVHREHDLFSDNSGAGSPTGAIILVLLMAVPRLRRTSATDSRIVRYVASNTPTSPTACTRACSCTSSDPSWVPVNDDLYAVRLLLSAACDQPGRGSRGTEPVSWE